MARFFDIGVIFRRRLKPLVESVHSAILRELIGVEWCPDKVTLVRNEEDQNNKDKQSKKENLVRNEEDWNSRIIGKTDLFIDIILPELDTAQCGRTRKIKHNHCTKGIFVVYLIRTKAHR
jgi:hypothetical protein